MRQQLRPKPNLSNPPSSPEVIRGPADETGSETDLAETDLGELAARFSAHGGGSLSAELSTDLALELVLHEIVEQACLATGATGAAIVLRRDGEMVCRASFGANAPALGSRLDPSSGVSGACIQSLSLQRCDDVLADAHADLEASHRLGVRSVMVMPLLRRNNLNGDDPDGDDLRGGDLPGNNLLGVFELLSSRPAAFGERDERTLEALAVRTLINLDRASRPLVAPIEFPAVLENVQENVPENVQETKTAAADAELHSGGAGKVANEFEETEAAEISPRQISPEVFPAQPSPRAPDFVTLVLGAAVLGCALMLSVLAGWHFGLQRVLESSGSIPSAGPSHRAGSGSAAADANAPGRNASPAPSAPAATPAANAVPPGGLRVYENGKEIFNLPPGQGQSGTADKREGPPASSLGASVGTSLGGSGNQAVPIQPPPNRTLPNATSADKAPAHTLAPAGTASTAPDRAVYLPPAVATADLTHRVEPEYPADALQQQIQGAVVLQVDIGANGAVDDARVVSGPAQLGPASVAAVKQWRFKPHRVNGQPVGVETTITLNFRLPG